MTNENYRIENKGNVSMCGRATSYHIYKRDGDRFIHVGSGFAKGWNASDEKCIADWLEFESDED